MELRLWTMNSGSLGLRTFSKKELPTGSDENCDLRQ
jgi:hypothetical protein